MGWIRDTKYDRYRRKGVVVLASFIISFVVLDTLVGAVFQNGLERYYGLNDNAPLALLGHSHLMLGIDKVMLEQELGVKVAKYTSEGVNVADRKMMADYLLQKDKALKTLIYGVDAWMFTGEGLSENSHVLFYPFMDDDAVGEFIKEKASPSEFWSKKLIKSTRYNEGLIASAMRGYLQKWDNLKWGKINVEKLRLDIAQGNYRAIKNEADNIKILRETIKMLKKEDVKIILLYIPTIDLVNEIQNKEFLESIGIFRELEAEYDNVEFLNLLEPFSHQHELFFDPIHLNPQGQKLVTEDLIKVLKAKRDGEK